MFKRIRQLYKRLSERVKKILLRPPSVVSSVWAESLTYLGEPALTELYNQVIQIEKQKFPGILIEAGCALGGSAIVIATAKSKQRPFFVYDVFDMIPPPSDQDEADVHNRYEVIKSGQSKGIRGKKYYGYEEDIFSKVTENFRKYSVPVQANNIHLIKGLFEDVLRVEEPVALAHLDGDWYSSVMTCLRNIEPRLVSGGVMIIDDYYTWSGCRKAVDEYFLDKQDKYKFIKKARLHIVRN